VGHAVAAPVFVEGGRVIRVALYRAGRDFSDRDCALLDALRRPLAAEFTAQEARLRARRALSQLDEFLAAANAAVIVLDAERRVRRCSERAAQWLSAGSTTAVRVGWRLPESIDRWVLAHVEPAWSPVDPGPLAIEGRTRRVELRLLAGEDATTLLLRSEPVGSAPREVGCTLTRREDEVLRWVAAGKSNAQIADILGLRPRTVHKHLEHVYCKLGVENRTSAVMRVLRSGG
jgi:DNA-binding CsgD family transcriptional regulator